LDGTFDLVFIDADKRNYLHYWNWTLKHVHAGSVILIDNVLWSGKVLEPATEKDFDTQVLQELNDLVAKDSRCEKVLLPLRDGLMMIRVKK
jgi:predicted O-methyltransferase YrrM